VSLLCRIATPLLLCVVGTRVLMRGFEVRRQGCNRSKGTRIKVGKRGKQQDGERLYGAPSWGMIRSRTWPLQALTGSREHRTLMTRDSTVPSRGFATGTTSLQFHDSSNQPPVQRQFQPVSNSLWRRLRKQPLRMASIQKSSLPCKPAKTSEPQVTWFSSLSL